MNLKNFKLNSTNKLKIFVILSYMICWLSISTSYEDIDNLILTINKFPYELTFFIVINFLRQLTVLLIFPILFFFCINLFLKKKNFFKTNLIFIFLFLYFFFQIPGLFITENSIKNISFVISSLDIIMIIILINSLFSNKEKEIFIYISIFLLILIFTLSISPHIPGFLTGHNNLYGGYLVKSDLLMEKTTPRSSGLARSALILIVFVDFLSKKYFKKYVFQKELIKIILITFIILLQSRTMLLLTIFYMISYYVFTINFSSKSLFKYLLNSFFLPSILAIVFFNISGSGIGKKEDYQKQDVLGEIYYNVDIIVRDMPSVGFTSGRTSDWKKLINEMPNYYVYGAGSQADRFLINQSASNGLLYAFSSSGIMGLIFFVVFSIMVFFKSMKLIFLDKYNNEKLLISLVILIILARSLLESSYAVFGLDLVIILTSLSLINNNYKTH